MSSLGALLARRSLLGAGLVAALLLCVGFLPLFAGPSYEYCLVAGVVLPSCAALIAAARSEQPGEYPWLDVFRVAGLLCLIGCTVALLHGLRVGFCDLPGGLSYFAAGPAAGTLLGASWGYAVRALAARAAPNSGWLRPALCVALPVSTILFSFWRYYSSPIIFAFDHFFGYFAGTLYDTEIEGLERLLSYRVGTIGGVLALLGIAPLIQVRSLRALRQHRLALLLSALGLGAAGLVTWHGPSLGHYQTDASIRLRLGHELREGRCNVVYAAGILPRDAELLGRECEAHLKRLEQYFEVQYAAPVTVYLFASAAQKAELMGARHVYIAKPWRREIYLQSGGFPHPVLGHELAHVVAGVFGTGPFSVAGPLAGVIPDPGRIEGFAVAAAPPEDDDLSVVGWAAAMQRLGILPPTQSLFRLGFLGENSSKAYTAAGAFVSFLRDRFGARALREWYAGKELSEVTALTVAELEARYLAHLSTVPLSETELAIASSRFERPALFARRCPHEVDEVLAQGNQALGELDLHAAGNAFRRVLALDPTDYSALVGLAQCALRSGDLGAAGSGFLQLAAGPVTQLQRAAVTERAADTALLAGEDRRAHELYSQVRSWVLDEDTQRTLELKQLAASAGADSPARRAIVALLLGEATLGSNWFEAGAALSAWASSQPEQGVADYLLARNLFSQGRWQAATARLDAALSREISGIYTARESRRLRLVVACAVQDLASAKRAYESYRAGPDASLSRREGVRRFAERCGVRVDAP
jgi:tetratricopeptide (TPR) repeat protein